MVHQKKESSPATGFFTVDMEDYYNVFGRSGMPEQSTWDSLEPRIDVGMMKLFDLFERKQIKATLFFLGYIARRHPYLVKEAIARGHEVASHGMYHRKVKLLNEREFVEDAKLTKDILEDMSGQPVIGWRCPGFFDAGYTPWFFERLIELGYQYDSSIILSRKGHKDYLQGDGNPGYICTPNGKLYEFPISVADFGIKKVNMFGGGYLRFFPTPLISLMKSRVVKEHPLLIYLHPREMDPDHPRFRLDLMGMFRSYVNLKTVPKKLEMLLKYLQFRTLASYYTEQLLDD